MSNEQNAVAVKVTTEVAVTEFGVIGACVVLAIVGVTLWLVLRRTGTLLERKPSPT